MTHVPHSPYHPGPKTGWAIQGDGYTSIRTIEQALADDVLFPKLDDDPVVYDYFGNPQLAH